MQAAAIGDVNGDGRNDLVVAAGNDGALPGTLYVLPQGANGSLGAPMPYAIGIRPISVALGDLNGDGRIDVAVGNFPSSGTPSIGVLLQNAQGGLNAMTDYPTPNSRVVRTGDVNGDGRTDLVGLSDDVDILLQTVSGTLAAPVTHPLPGSYYEFQVADASGDGRDDLVLSSNGVTVVAQTPGGTFASAVSYPLTPGGSWGLAIADFNSDGRNDVAFSGGSLVVLYQTSQGTLFNPTFHPLIGDGPAAAADGNSDGRADAFVLPFVGNLLETYLQTPGGSLATEVRDDIPHPGTQNPDALAVGDLNGDGGPDVVAVGPSAGVTEASILYRVPFHDVAVSISGGPDPSPAGSDTYYHVTARNVGALPLTGVTVTDTLPEGATLVSVTPAPSCTVAGRVVTCSLGNLAPNEDKTASLVVTTPSATGTIVNEATAAAHEADGDLSNNSATSSLQLVVPACSQPVRDGGFENQIQPQWVQSSTNGVVLCTLSLCGTGGGTAGPNNGNAWGRFGGAATNIQVRALAQSLTIPRGKATLQFYLWLGAHSGNGTDYLRVLIDGAQVFIVTEAETAYDGSYHLVNVDVRAYADGQAHELRFESAAFGPGVTSFNVDDVLMEACPHPQLAVGPVQVGEGDTGLTTASFPLTLSEATPLPVSVHLTTANGTAAAGTDYLPAAGTVVIPPGTTNTTLDVSVVGDRVFEPDEAFSVQLAGSVNAILVQGLAAATIENDDVPGFSIEDMTVVEPENGARSAMFTVRLAPPSGGTVSYSTIDGTAMAGLDYVAASGTLTFPPGTDFQTIDILINADADEESPESFAVELTNPSGAGLAHGEASGTIFDRGFYTLPPCRVLDTRGSVGQLGGPALSAGAVRSFRIPAACGVPSGARVVSLNIAVTQPTAPGHLRLYPVGSPLPLVSNINYLPGQTRSNNMIVRLGASGDLAVFCNQASGGAHLIVDVNGYFAE
jgi:uncharacterized repeat protein (TIGR01451 family)